MKVSFKVQYGDEIPETFNSTDRDEFLNKHPEFKEVAPLHGYIKIYDGVNVVWTDIHIAP
uniref:Uncharacterized protein n=1 Tax=viral metagenome TaxID=1070528 RepID=A0A6M3L2F3_9ZZZZ